MGELLSGGAIKEEAIVWRIRPEGGSGLRQAGIKINGHPIGKCLAGCSRRTQQQGLNPSPC
jgi:hypothetical protein